MKCFLSVCEFFYYTLHVGEFCTLLVLEVPLSSNQPTAWRQMHWLMLVRGKKMKTIGFDVIGIIQTTAWRISGKNIRILLCCRPIVCSICAQWYTHIYEQLKLTVDCLGLYSQFWRLYVQLFEQYPHFWCLKPTLIKQYTSHAIAFSTFG